MGISWILLIAALLFLLQHVVFNRWGFRGLTIKRTFNQAYCHAGDRIEMIETIQNRKLTPIPWLRLESTIHAGLRFAKMSNLAVSSGAIFQNHRSLFSLMPYTRIVRRHQVICAKRGWYKLETVSASIGDLVGTQAATRSQRLDVELLVYPRLVSRDDIPLLSSRWQGDITVKRWIMPDPFLVSGVREYRYGDTMNSIHWKATARSQRLQVYNREFTADPRLFIIVNTQITATMWDAVSDPELVEIGLSYAATLAEYAISQGVPVGFGYNGSLTGQPGTPVHISPAGGHPHLAYLFETMAKLAISYTRSCSDFLDECILQEGSALDIILLTAFVSDAVEESIQQLEASGHTVFIVPLQHGLLNLHEKEESPFDVNAAASGARSAN
ncbi:DUF58 domain-containing protein [Paenibacillus aceris]|uniref:Uncharacterized protein (DUF58 family) n=1 Tax=Paenibacillus aceris TaxID=869555 RepID=A0ABS4IA02_9BACL|nr:DUF58 domain-containing protein [Paenibacillus aceris]MBP1967316.1 uncharacterized protein (DUF58 family) [Paenibacillus aceris]NHW38043.1 DUF58 domain-containing protein [Paenibacillus aceris]